MGIYDREYYRREGNSFLGSFTERGKVCKYLILTNVVMFVLQLITRSGEHHGMDLVTTWLALDVKEVMHGQVWRLLTYAFLHDPGDLFHIVFNMLFLWWFGTDVEDLYGPREFLAVYLTAAFLGGVGFVLGYLAHVGGEVCIGASGAVMAVLVLCALHYPTRVIRLFFFLPVPIWIFVLFEIGRDAFTMLSGAHSSTAVTVHLSGAAFAYLYYKRQWRLLDLWSSLRGWQRTRSRPRLRVYREEPQPTAVSANAPQIAAAPDVDEHLEAKLDAVLEKVARHGQGSLTDSERQVLVRASEIYRKRRS